jgi:hypothetical protein
MAKNNAVGVPETRIRSDVRPILFLDIDGVLLRRRNAVIFDAFELAPGCLKFLEWATARFRCLWLTSRARMGWPDGIRRAFRAAGAVLDEPRWAILDLIESAPWTAHKCEAIDPKSDFWWIDDDPTAHDRGWLRAHGCEDRLIEISTDTYPDALTQLIRSWNRDGVEKSRRH